MTTPRKQNRCRTDRRETRRGFTLVEMMIVIMAMVIMAGMVIPQYLEAVADAKKSTALHNVVMLTVAIERYKLHHYGDPPDILTEKTLPQLTAKTDEYGNMGSGPLYIYGPTFLRGFPKTRSTARRMCRSRRPFPQKTWARGSAGFMTQYPVKFGLVKASNRRPSF